MDKDNAKRRLAPFVIDGRTISIIFLVIFGIFGYGVVKGTESNNLIKEVIFSSVLLAAIGILVFSPSLDKKSSCLEIHVRRKYVRNVGAIFIFLLILFRNNLSRNLTVDELYISWLSHIHSQIMLEKLFISFPEALGKLPARILIQVTSLMVLLTVLIFSWFLTRIKSKLWFFTTVTISIILLRLFFLRIGGAVGYISPTVGIPYLIFTSFFGIHDEAFRIAALLIIAFTIGKSLELVVNWNLRIVFVFGFLMLFYSIPIMRIMSPMVEVSSFGFAVSMLTFSYINKMGFVVNQKLLYFVSLATYVRVSAIWLLFSLIALERLQNSRRGKVKSKFNWLPLVVAVPGIFNTYRIRVGQIDVNQEGFFRVLMSRIEDVGSTLGSTNTGYLLIPIVISFFIGFDEKHRTLDLMLFATMFLGTFYLSIPKEYVGDSKYLIEWLIPGFFVSVIRLVAKIQAILEKKKSKFSVCSIIVMIFSFVNVFGIYEYGNLVERYKGVYAANYQSVDAGREIFPFVPYAYSQIYNSSELLHNKDCLTVGAVYSVMPEVLSGMNVEKVVRTKEVRRKFLEIQSNIGENWLDVTDASLRQSGVKCVVISAIENQQKVVISLMNSGWIEVGRFIEPEFETSVSIMQRN